MSSLRLLVILSIVGVVSPTFSADAEWGDLSGRFVYDGEPPRLTTIPVTKDQAVLGQSVQDESLLVNADNRGVANVAVYLISDDGALCVHPSYQRSADSKVTLTMRDGRFEPHLLLIRTTQTMLQLNKDDIAHHARITFLENPPM